jgi:putative NADH-flavin reductase
MKLAVFGGTGKTGKHVVEQALAAGHEVVALARTPSKFEINHPKLKVVQGDVKDPNCVATTIEGTDGVVSVLGPTNNKPEFAVTKGMENILSAMQQHRVRRLIISAGAGVRDPQDRPKLVDRFFGLVLKVASKNVVEDMIRAVTMVRSSDRDWTVVRVPMLTDDPKKNQIRTGYLGDDVGVRLSRADMADYMLRQLDDPSNIHKAPVISN